MERDLSARLPIARGRAGRDMEDPRGELGVDDDVPTQPSAPPDPETMSSGGVDDTWR